jgi:hypothetical protein
MKFFPTTEAYAVSYVAGASGTFIMVLMANFLNILDNPVFSKHGHVHDSEMDWNQAVNESFDPALLKDGQIFSRFLETNPSNPETPILLSEHYPIDYDLFFEKYPKGKVLYIQVDPIKDRMILEANFYFKVQVDCYHSIPYWHTLWNSEKDMYFNGANTPHDSSITNEMIVRLLKDRAIMNNKRTSSPLNLGDIVDMPNVLTYSFNDILTNKEKTLDMISRLTNRPIPSSAHKIYDDYLKAQYLINNFLDEHLRS